MILFLIALIAIFQLITYWYWKKKMPSYSLIHPFLFYIGISILIFPPLCEFIFESPLNENSKDMACGMIIPPSIVAGVMNLIVVLITHFIYKWVKKKFHPFDKNISLNTKKP